MIYVDLQRLGIPDELQQELEQATGELVALELREALDALGGILGCGADDGVLQRIFSRFCIGK